MSSRRRVGFSEGNGTVSIDLFLKPMLTYRLFDYVHLIAQKLRQPALEIVQPAEVVETVLRETLAQAHRNIDVVNGIFPTRHRAEQGYAHNPCGTDLVFVRLQDRNDLVTYHRPILPTPATDRDACRLGRPNLGKSPRVESSIQPGYYPVRSG